MGIVTPRAVVRVKHYPASKTLLGRDTTSAQSYDDDGFRFLNT